MVDNKKKAKGLAKRKNEKREISVVLLDDEVLVGLVKDIRRYEFDLLIKDELYTVYKHAVKYIK